MPARIIDEPVVVAPDPVEAGAANILALLKRHHRQNKRVLQRIRQIVGTNTRAAIIAELGAELAPDVLTVYAAFKAVSESVELGGETIDDIPA